MEIITVKTFTATIYVGFKELKTGVVRDITSARKICQDYCDMIGLCVSVKPTEFIYKNGYEPGCKVRLINYPRFPSTPSIILNHAINLAKLLKSEYKQCRVSIITPEETIMVSGDE